ncbi:MAG: class I SAM-dependent methyltransferase [bacterium]
MEAEVKKVQTYFDKIAWEFDTIYNGRKSFVLRILDKIFRWDMYKRFELTLAECRKVKEKSILDIGCGPGRFCFPLANRGASRVLGMDFAQNMIDLAAKLSQEQDIHGTCEFCCADFLSFPFAEKFDYILAIGLFDYLKEPQGYLRKINSLTREKFVATFPTRWTYRRFVRKIRLGLKNCPVYFFSKSQIQKLYRDVGFSGVSVKRIGKIYFVVARVAGNSREHSP